MTTTYKIVPFKEAPEDYEGEHDDPWGDYDYCWAVVRCEDDAIVERIGYDGGEPEDQTLTRNWSWVSDALQKAYDLGRSHA